MEMESENHMNGNPIESSANAVKTSEENKQPEIKHCSEQGNVTDVIGNGQLVKKVCKTKFAQALNHFVIVCFLSPSICS